MCMEDVRIGRKKYSRVTVYVTDANGQAVIGASPKRTGVLIGGVAGQTVTISDKAQTAAGQGVLAVATVTLVPVQLEVEIHGNFVMQDIFLFSAAAQNIGVLETFLDDE